ncbi:MAG TPA: RNA-binding domain-containing protein [Thermoanaerobaculia bacterium]|nr:RNA-binding domain-containing protein [Thermoanaerobaculia bacterium]
MTDPLQQLSSWMEDPEDEHLEFKEARNQFRLEELIRYCCALANERGGRIILGVTDRRPRRVVGTAAFRDLQSTKLSLVQALRLRVEIIEIQHPEGRVLVFEVPSRPLGLPMQVSGAYWMRSGESVVPMTPDLLKKIFDEAQPDFSAEVCPRLRLDELDPRAIDVFRTRWAERSRRDDLLEIGAEQLLQDADLVSDDGITYAALILLGTGPALVRHLAHAEMIYEYRVEESSIEYQQRIELRRGFLLDHDDLWTAVNARNEVFSYRDGPFRRDILAFDEGAVREAVLNAVSHRDYRLQGSTFIRQTRTKITIVSPGGFPPGVGPDNILFKQMPRNRRLAEALARCGLVERSGQGADRMFATAIREGKLPPDFSESDENQVGVTLHGTVQDEAFITFLEGLAKEKERSFRVRDLFVLDAVHRGRPVPEDLRDHVSDLLGVGALERVGRNRLVLARRFYVLKGQPGEHTRRRGLDRETRKELLFQHIQSSGNPGTPFEELTQVLPGATRNELKVLLRELKEAGRIHPRGTTRAARWYPGPMDGALE